MTHKRLTELTPLQAYRKGFLTRRDYLNRTAGPDLTAYCFCGKSNLWDAKCASCGKRPYTD
jgi:hypothetical protein